MSSGGYSFVVITVHNTAARKTIAPILNEYSTDSGMPVAITPTTPNAVNRYGNAFASVWPMPMNQLCITKPSVR